MLLKSVTRTQGNNKALKDGAVKPRTFAFEFVEVDPLIDAFRRMVRGLEFDLCEMAMTTYVGAIEKPTAVDETCRRVMEITGKDPLPYGIAPNRQALEELIASALEQKALTRPVTVEELFPSNTHGLVG